ncbi:hypothetical protein EDM80_03535 [bacterium]|nr:MAG: hypothetical protein EDM80_03535 [bacterium]RIK64126.1 MAG: hypothetical protein DCC64_05285 [Planctomycetota bacterium]
MGAYAKGSRRQRVPASDPRELLRGTLECEKSMLRRGQGRVVTEWSEVLRGVERVMLGGNLGHGGSSARLKISGAYGGDPRQVITGEVTKAGNFELLRTLQLPVKDLPQPRCDQQQWQRVHAAGRCSADDDGPEVADGALGLDAPAQCIAADLGV